MRACVQVGAPINRTAFRVSTSVGLYITCHGDWSCEPAAPSASPELAEPTRGAIDVLFANSSLEADVDVVPLRARTSARTAGVRCAAPWGYPAALFWGNVRPLRSVPPDRRARACANTITRAHTHTHARRGDTVACKAEAPRP
jgi:hypothetical protein